MIAAVELLIVAFVVVVLFVVAAPQPLREITMAIVWVGASAIALFAAGAWVWSLLRLPF
jgi:hypothetical protein